MLVYGGRMGERNDQNVLQFPYEDYLFWAKLHEKGKKDMCVEWR